MKFKVNAKSFKANLKLINAITKSFDFNNIADSILFRLKNNTLTLRAMNDLSSVRAQTAIEDKNFKETEFLVNANKLYKIIKFSDEDELQFELKSEDTHEGKGHLIFHGNSKVEFPLKPLMQYPNFPNYFGNYVSVNEDFIDNLSTMTNFVHKKATNYLSGINVNSNTLISTDKVVVMLMKHNYNFANNVTISTDIPSVIKRIDNPKISTEDTMFRATGTIEGWKVETAHSVINDDFPTDLVLNTAKEWGTEEDKHRLKFDLFDLQKINRKVKSITGKGDEEIKIEVKPEKTVFKYRENQFSFQQTIPCESEATMTIKTRCKRLNDIVTLANKAEIDDIVLFIHADKTDKLIFKDNFMYVAELMDLTIN